MPKCILIVDDSAVVRKTLRQTLEWQKGWEVCGEAANGRDGIETAQRLKPDLVLLDFSMPVMNGLEAARELKRLLPYVPFDVDRCIAYARQVNPALKVLQLSVLKGDGMEAWYSFLRERKAAQSVSA